MVKDRTLSSKMLDGVVHLVMVIVVIVTLFPVLNIIAVSFSSPEHISNGSVVLFPKGFNLSAYRTILFEDVHIPKSFLNSVFITLAGTIANVIITTITAYSLSKKYLVLRGYFITFVVIPMFFGGGIIPLFLVVKSLGMVNSYSSLIIPSLMSPWWLIIMISFFRTFPVEIEEAAKIDGCSDLGALIRIVLPLSTAAVATISLFYAVAHWNSFFSAMMYLNDYNMYPLQLILRDIVLQNSLAEQLAASGNVALANDVQSSLTPQSVQYATLVISIIPMLIVYPFIQNYFVKGIMIGSLKG
ncbi:carbohydrate ABC transporter permease [Paenibacillus sp. GCM10023248]|uniref:carbohydrate ABC transporter permease n=1 Tax=unclassified Paenibacillus TaxID=185978 RepID=UPI002379AD7E|nr:carbohydrate ABC transporter permease [Paenibacillus sp. MAHUQ-63]MDD9268247.1 carbohydrate ABC transporter permease [Paenibacillus sp. MAHUQ-63]